MEQIKRAIPNALTLANLACGILSIYFSLTRDINHYLLWAGGFILLAAIFDFLDGFAARLLKVNNPIGKDLDSLADMVTFGVAPAFIAFSIASINHKHWALFLIFIYALCAAIRLAKFNVDTNQTKSFIGLPSPAAGMMLAAWPWMLEYDIFDFKDLLMNPYVLGGTSIALGLLMVSSLPMFSFKIDTWSWQANRVKFGFLIICIALISLFYFQAMPIIIFLYILISVLRNFAK